MHSVVLTSALAVQLPQLTLKILPNYIMSIKDGYPPLYDCYIPLRAWFGSYVMTYRERDVRQVPLLAEGGVYL